MKTYIIKSNYEYEIEANSAEEAIERWSEIIEDELGVCNETLSTKFIESLEAKELNNHKII